MVVRVAERHGALERRSEGPWLHAEHAAQLVGPSHGVAADIPFPAADLSDSLSVGEQSQGVV